MTTCSISINPPRMARDLPNGPWQPLGQILSTTPNIWTVFCDVYISIIVERPSCPPSSSTDKANANNNKIDEPGIIDLKPINILMTAHEISSNIPEIFKGLNQWALATLGLTLIYNTKDMNSITWYLYINSCQTVFVSPLFFNWKSYWKKINSSNIGWFNWSQSIYWRWQVKP